MTANHYYETQHHAFHPFGCESKVRNRRNLAGSEPLAVAKPKDRALFVLILTRCYLPQNIVYTFQLNSSGHTFETVRVSGASINSVRFQMGESRAPFGGKCAFEMVVNHVGGDDS
jgi:hypothetical protein